MMGVDLLRQAHHSLPERTAGLTHERYGAGPTLVLLHPLGADRNVWGPVLPLLTREREVLTVDLPGFGASRPLADPDPIPRKLALAVGELLRELDLDGGRAHVAGNSLGGWVALEMAAAGQAASVTAIAPAGLWSSPLGPKPQRTRRLAQLALPVIGPAMRNPKLRRMALAGTLAAPDRVPAADAAALVRAYARAPGFTAVNRSMRANVFTSLSSIAVPVTLAWPEHDTLVTRPEAVPAEVREVFLAGCGHVPMWDDPQAVASLLLSGSSATGAQRAAKA